MLHTVTAVTHALVAQARESSGLQIVSRVEIQAQLKAATTRGRVQGRAAVAMPRPQIVVTLAGGEAGDKYVLQDKAKTQVETAWRAKRRAEKRCVDSDFCILFFQQYFILFYI